MACIKALKADILNIRLIKNYFYQLVKLVQRYHICLSVLEIYANVDTLSC